MRKIESVMSSWRMLSNLWVTLERRRPSLKPIASLVRPILQVLPRRRVHRPHSRPTRDGVFCTESNGGAKVMAKKIKLTQMLSTLFFLLLVISGAALAQAVFGNIT